ncbi:MAG: DUF1049 domain-containing protein [Candidatus Omnitrophica bacterium]|nr:DUF1049 domain-containing protein [Candidatus Omnitrophota bacterium]
MNFVKVAWLSLGILFFVILIQNTQVVAIRFLFWKLSMSGILLLAIVLLVGSIIGFFVGKYVKWHE